MQWNPENQKEFETLLTRYPQKRAALLPTLWLAQKQFGWISTAVMEYVASLLDLPVIKVYEVVSFYTMFHQKPVGKYHIQVCRTLSCELCGKEAILEHLQKTLGITTGQMTHDQKFSLVEVECLGSCGSAPMIQINDDYYENLTTEKVDEVIASLK